MNGDDFFIDKTLDICEKYTGRRDITFIIQGKMTNKELLIKNIRNLCKYGRVVLAIWELEDNLKENEINNFISRNRINNEQNIYLQVYTTLYGLEKVNTAFVIKVRGDEIYINFKEFIKEMEENKSKIITNNVFFRETKKYPYHISDHIIGGLKENVKKMFINCRRALETNKVLPKVSKGIPEQWLTVSYLISFYTEETLNKADNERMTEIMKENFVIIPLEEFMDFIVVYTKQLKGGKKVKQNVKGIKELKDHKIVDITGWGTGPTHRDPPS